MRNIVPFNTKWAFSKETQAAPTAMPQNWYWVNLPHTWNGIDGQDGGSDYYRGTCYYANLLPRSELPKAARYYLEIRGAAYTADVWVNGKALGHHEGGFSTWRVNITDALTEEENLVVFAVDNSANDRVYPQMADFTFYGGLYRPVYVICVPDSHFELDYLGTPGLKVTPTLNGADADVETEVWLTGAKEGQTLTYTVTDAAGAVVAEAAVPAAETKQTLHIPGVHRWHGRKDPYLYTMRVALREGDEELDTVSTRFGCRSFVIDPERGFILNGEEYPLRGVTRHQDRDGIGNALLPCHHEEDIALIMEVGATTIRLAHYQHDQYFYDLCDEKGLVIWAEIPYISQHMPTGRANTISQMKELIVQNYNHPSIVVWGLSNEITMRGEADPDLLENHHILNDLCHQLDKTRLTTMACLSNCAIDSDYVHIPDVVSYNHYFGWYGGDTSMNGPWLDDFHAKYPNTPIGVSEYGAEALNWHTSTPEQGDYTEEYQAYYHEELIKQLYSRPYIWATHVWNMFDFGCDGRNEGGEAGQNHKGLVTIDRRYKKDAFYAYKAWLSDEPFVHLCGKRYVDRVEDVTRVTVYSNLPEVELFANGVSLGSKRSPEHFFYFDVPNAGVTELKAVAGDCTDTSTIRKVEKFNEAYRMREKGAILNWFDVTAPEGYFSLNDKLGEIIAKPQGMLLLGTMFAKFAGSAGGGAPGGMDPKALVKMVSGFSLLRLVGMLGMTGIKVTKEQLLELNAKLNKIRK